MSTYETQTYDRDWCDLPAVEVGDEVRVKYISHRSGSEQIRRGEVTEMHVNGFTFDHDPEDNCFTSVRAHYHRDRGVEWSVDTVTERSGMMIHATKLNEGNRDPDDVEIEVQ